VNEIVEKDNLARDYNIYIFHGTDGDDWDTDGSKTIPELRTMLGYSSRIGITVAKSSFQTDTYTTLERYMHDTRILNEHPSLIRMDLVRENDSEDRLIEGIKNLIS
jgi:hypothetical protein